MAWSTLLFHFYLLFLFFSAGKDYLLYVLFNLIPSFICWPLSSLIFISIFCAFPSSLHVHPLYSLSVITSYSCPLIDFFFWFVRRSQLSSTFIAPKVFLSTFLSHISIYLIFVYLRIQVSLI